MQLLVLTWNYWLTKISNTKKSLKKSTAKVKDKPMALERLVMQKKRLQYLKLKLLS